MPAWLGGLIASVLKDLLPSVLTWVKDLVMSVITHFEEKKRKKQKEADIAAALEKCKQAKTEEEQKDAFKDFIAISNSD